MIPMFYISMIFLMISLILMFLNFMISKKLKLNREKSSPFECGFDPLSANRPPFSIQFFMISLIFLIFDIEITILIPLIHLTSSLSGPLILTSLIFLLMLLYGLYMEYLEQTIDWKI
uniref:NADH dehydrogenase subunit 3 n=1 Tax=Stenamma diecki TaxID=625352 RepID=UPI001FCDEA9D|nr:NADH dehydrogenase subunit 3 [Stenamma diecki]UNZ99533.1 NADH dehydrogenase subunit 3 [Stenamma diecki]